MINWKSVLLQQTPYHSVLQHTASSLEFQRELYDNIFNIKDKISGAYLESFLREYYRNVVDFDDSLMELYLVANKSPHHNYRYYEWENQSVRIESSNLMVSHGTTANHIWEAGVALSEYLIVNPFVVRDKKILELGCGTGLCGLVSMKAGAQSVALSDLATVLENVTKKNVDSSVELIDFDWRYPESIDLSRYNLVIASDIIFDPSMVPSIVDILKLAKGHQIEVVLCQKIRNIDTFQMFCNQLVESGLSISDISPSHLFYYGTENIKLIKL